MTPKAPTATAKGAMRRAPSRARGDPVRVIGTLVRHDKRPHAGGGGQPAPPARRSGPHPRELARASGIAKATLSALEAGKGNPTIETLSSLATALGRAVRRPARRPKPPSPCTSCNASEGTSVAGTANTLRLHRPASRLAPPTELYEARFPPRSRCAAGAHGPGRVSTCRRRRAPAHWARSTAPLTCARATTPASPPTRCPSLRGGAARRAGIAHHAVGRSHDHHLRGTHGARHRRQRRDRTRRSRSGWPAPAPRSPSTTTRTPTRPRRSSTGSPTRADERPRSAPTSPMPRSPSSSPTPSAKLRPDRHPRRQPGLTGSRASRTSTPPCSTNPRDQSARAVPARPRSVLRPCASVAWDGSCSRRRSPRSTAASSARTTRRRRPACTASPTTWPPGWRPTASRST